MQLQENVKAKLASLLEKVSNANASLISEAINGRFTSNNTKRLEAFVLGVKYKVEAANTDITVLAEDPLNREEDTSRLFVYMLNAVERALSGRKPSGKGRMISLSQLQGGQSAKLYERRIVNFLAVEMDESTSMDVEAAVKCVDGRIVEHADATWSFEVTPFTGVRLRVVFWQGEEGIPSGATLLLGEEVKDMDMPIEELIVIAEMTVNRFVQFYRKTTGKKPKTFDSLYI